MTPRFSIGTLITKPALYADMRASFEAKGFVGDVEWIGIDNTGPVQTDAYDGLNRVLDQARGTYVILCHQDVVMHDHDRAHLEARLDELTRLAPHWGVAANAGGAGARHIPRRISDAHGDNQAVGPFPHAVDSVDENFMVLRRAARLAFSRDIGGFHLYGADICLVADMLGYSAHVIDFHLRHLSGGTIGPDFRASETRFRAKWGRALRRRDVQTTCTFMSLSGQPRSALRTSIEESVALRAGRIKRSLAKRRSESP